MMEVDGIIQAVAAVFFFSPSGDLHAKRAALKAGVG